MQQTGTLLIETLDPEGKPLTLSGELELSSGERRTWHSGEPVEVSGSRLEVFCAAPPGRWSLRLTPSTPTEPQLVTLRLARLEVWLSDPGGRELGGLPLRVLLPEQPRVSRIGVPILLWEGETSVEVGSREARVAVKRLDVLVRPARTTLELGKLAALVVRWGDGHGWPLRALRLDSDVITAVGLQDPNRGLEQCGRTGEPLRLWPGRYQVSIEGGPSSPVDVHGGHLTELDMSDSDAHPLDRFRRDLIRGITRRAASLEAQPSASSLLTSRVMRLAARLPLPPRAAADPPGRAKLSGPILEVRGKDARGYPLTGWPLTLHRLEGKARVESQGEALIQGRVGAPLTVSSGRWAVRLAGICGVAGEVRMEDRPAQLELPALGALEVILRDGQGRSLRGMGFALAPLAGADAGSQETQALGQPVLLLAGRYHLWVPTQPPIEQDVVIQSGQVEVVDLGALGELDLSPGPEAPPGTLLWLRPLALRRGGSQAPPDLPASFEVGDDLPGAVPFQTLEVRVGERLELLPGTYLVGRGSPEGEGVPIEVRAGRMRRPTVVGRSVESLAHEDANRER